MNDKEIYNKVAFSGDLNYRFDRGTNAKINLYGEERGIKWVTKTPRLGENENLNNNELLLLRLLQNTGVVPQLYQDYIDDSWGKHDDIVMQLINNAGSLCDYAEATIAGEVPIKTFEKILEESVKSIDLFHESGVIHNDLHANNLIVTMDKNQNWQVYIIDFGWSYKGDIPRWIEYERSWIARDSEDDLIFLKRGLENLYSDYYEEYSRLLNIII